ncbi:MAG: hypothetical protein LBL86_07830 [Coriobacteriales bacterium]|jgi:hypothetical protein|nr:hypothetical protein [Coriobacteriales bacterium]
MIDRRLPKRFDGFPRLEVAAPVAMLVGYVCLDAAAPSSFWLATFFLVCGFVPTLLAALRLWRLRGRSIYFEIGVLITLALVCKALTYVFQFCNVLISDEWYQFFSVVGLGDAGFFLFLFAATLVMNMGIPRFNAKAALVAVVLAALLFFVFARFGRLNDVIHLFCLCLAVYGALLRLLSELKGRNVFMWLVVLLAVSIAGEIYFLDIGNKFAEDWMTTVNTALSCLLFPAATLFFGTGRTGGGAMGGAGKAGGA